MKKVIYIFLLLFFSFCTKEKYQYPRIIVPQQKNVVEVNSNEMLNVYSFFPLGFNFNNDFKIKEIEHRFDSIKGKIVPYDSVIPKYNLKVIIDTSYIISNNWFEYKFLPRPKGVIQDGLINGKIPTEEDFKNSKKEIDKYINFKNKLLEDKVLCYPLLIYNNSNQDVCLKLEFIQEAKDFDGKWKPIEFTFEYEMCGTGKRFQNLLNPKKYAAFSIIKYNGNFKTKIRVKLKNNNHIYYSNEIEGTINRSQFNQDFCKSFLESYGSSVDMKDFEKYKNSMFLRD